MPNVCAGSGEQAAFGVTGPANLRVEDKAASPLWVWEVPSPTRVSCGLGEKRVSETSSSGFLSFLSSSTMALGPVLNCGCHGRRGFQFFFYPGSEGVMNPTAMDASPPPMPGLCFWPPREILLKT